MNKQHPAIELLRSDIVQDMSLRVSDITSLPLDDSLLIVRNWLLNQLALRWETDRVNGIDEREIDREPVFTESSNVLDTYLESHPVVGHQAILIHNLLRTKSHEAIKKIKKFSESVDNYTCKVESVGIGLDTMRIDVTLSDGRTDSVTTRMAAYDNLSYPNNSDELIYCVLKRYETVGIAPTGRLNGESAILVPPIDTYVDYVGWFWDIDRYFESYCPYPQLTEIQYAPYYTSSSRPIETRIELPPVPAVISHVINRARQLVRTGRDQVLIIYGQVSSISPYLERMNFDSYVPVLDSVEDGVGKYLLHPQESDIVPLDNSFDIDSILQSDNTPSIHIIMS